MPDLTCTQCNKPFEVGAWYGCAGNNTRKHRLPKKTYYAENDRLTVNAVPATTVVAPNGSALHVPGAIITFTGGMYVTDDPEIQEVLDRRCPLTKEEYMDKRMTPQLKAARDRGIVEEQKALIDTLKAENAKLREGKGQAPADPVMGNVRRKAASAAKPDKTN